MYTAPLVTARMLTARVIQETLKVGAQVIVRDLAVGLAAELVFHRGSVVHVVGRIAKDHVGQAAGQDLFNRLDLGGVAAEEAMLT